MNIMKVFRKIRTFSFREAVHYWLLHHNHVSLVISSPHDITDSPCIAWSNVFCKATHLVCAQDVKDEYYLSLMSMEYDVHYFTAIVNHEVIHQILNNWEDYRSSDLLDNTFALRFAKGYSNPSYYVRDAENREWE